MEIIGTNLFKVGGSADCIFGIDIKFKKIYYASRK